jgi:hypothetical protein
MAGKIEGDQAEVVRDPAPHLVPKDAPAEQVTMDEEHGEVTSTSLLDHKGAVRCDHAVFAHRKVHGHALWLITPSVLPARAFRPQPFAATV